MSNAQLGMHSYIHICIFVHINEGTDGPQVPVGMFFNLSFISRHLFLILQKPQRGPPM